MAIFRRNGLSGKGGRGTRPTPGSRRPRERPRCGPESSGQNTGTPVPAARRFVPPAGRQAGRAGAGSTAILGARQGCRRGAGRPEADIGRLAGIHIPHNTIRGAMREENPAAARRKKGRRHKRVRHEGDCQNPARRADSEQLCGGRRPVSHAGGASRFMAGFGAFPGAAAESAPEAPGRAVADRGRPPSILPGRGPRFCHGGSAGKKRGSPGFGAGPAAPGIGRIPRGAGRPRAGGKPGRSRGGVRRWLPTFAAESAGRTAKRGSPGGRAGDVFHAAGRRDPTTGLVDWHCSDRARESPDPESAEAPAVAFARKMPAAVGAGAGKGGESGAWGAY